MTKSPGRRFGIRVFIAALLTIALVLAACGSDSDSESESQGELPSGFPRPEVTSVKIGVSALAPGPNIAQLALDADLYEKYGLSDVEIIYFEGSGRALQAIVSGQVEATVDNTQGTLSSLLTDDPLIDVASFHNSFVDCIVSSPDVRSPEDLVEKRMAVSTLGGQSHAEVVVALTEFGLTTEDVEIIQVGGQDSRVAALQAGSVEAIPVECALEDELTAEGFNVLLRLPEVETQMPNAPITWRKEFVEDNPNTVLAVSAACLEAMQLLFEDTDFAIESYADFAQVPLEDARRSIEPYLDVAQRDLRWTHESYLTVQDFLVLTNPAVAAVDVREAYTFEFVERLEELGLYDELGVPADEP